MRREEWRNGRRRDKRRGKEGEEIKDEGGREKRDVMTRTYVCTSKWSVANTASHIQHTTRQECNFCTIAEAGVHK